MWRVKVHVPLHHPVRIRTLILNNLLLLFLPLSLLFPFSKNEERHARTTTGFNTSSPFTTTIGSEALAFALRTATQRRCRVASRCSRQPVSFFSLFMFRFTDTHHTLCTHTGIASRGAAAASHAGSPLQATVCFFFFFFSLDSC